MGKLGKKDFFDRFSGLARECLNWIRETKYDLGKKKELEI